MKRKASMKRKAIMVPALAFAAMTAGAAVSPEDVWLAADFDLPMEIAGQAVYPKVDERNLVEGRWGKAFYCHREAVNTLTGKDGGFVETALPKEVVADGATTALPAGTNVVATADDPMKYSWIRPEGGLTWSCFVKGPKGAVVKLIPTLTPPTEAAIKAATRKHKYTNENAFKEVTVISTNVLDGTWQRVWCGIKHDCRTTEGRKTTFTIEASAPVEMKMLMLESSQKYPYWTLKPSKYVKPGDDRKQRAIVITDPEIVKDFPTKEGSTSFWARSYEDEWTQEGWGGMRVWNYESGRHMLSFDGEFRLGSFWKVLRPKWDERFHRSYKWQHVVNVWRQGGQCEIWIDGVMRAATTNEALSTAQSDKNREFRIGTSSNGWHPGDLAIDDFVVFKRALTESEIKDLTNAKEAFRATGTRLYAGAADFCFYRRHQKDAALRFTVDAPKAGEWKYETTIGGRTVGACVPACPTRDVKLQKGKNWFAAPFDPSDFRVGKYDWSVKFFNPDGKVALEKTGTLEIRPRRDPNAPMYMSWGGIHGISYGFMHLTGLDAANADYDGIRRMREMLAAGIRPNIRFGNSTWWKENSFDADDVKRRVTEAFKPFEGLCDWNTTLINTEVYGTWVTAEAAKYPFWNQAAEAATGFKPDLRFGQCPYNTPSEVKWNQIGKKAPRGTIKHDIPALETLRWMERYGQPVYWINRLDCEAIHALDPDNVVWSEPVHADTFLEFVDMAAGWHYSYPTEVIYRALDSDAAVSRRYSKAYMPTLSMYNNAPGQHPTRKGADGKPEKVTMGQSFDELSVKTWLCLGVGRVDHMSMFSADSWEEGVRDYGIWKTNAEAKVARIADPDAPARYGEFVRRRMMPALELVRGLDRVRSKTAIIETGATFYAGGYGWGGYHCREALRNALSKCGVPYDVLKEDEAADAKTLAQYKYVYNPMSSVIFEEHDRALREAAAKGTIIVQDSFGENDYPNGVKLAPYDQRNVMRRPEIPVIDFFTNRTEEILALSPSVSDGDGARDTYTLEKELGGVRYVMVINNHRKLHSEGGGVLTTFCTNEWYRPYGAAAKIATTIRGVGENAALYEFNAAPSAKGGDQPCCRPLVVSKGGGALSVSGDYGPGEARIFCVYPEALEAPEVEYADGDTKRAGRLIVTLETKSGKPAPGRTVVELTLTDPEGRVTDESGRYTVENGRAEIAVEFAANDPDGGFFSRWKAEVRDLTTGETGSCGFRR